uniref:Mediator of RNA polymerase II transcription subunit 24 n=1 Tax=Panagrolaimus sp. JU765 TaxID=591449 RepID=A0AC34RJQ2_9BILA
MSCGREAAKVQSFISRIRKNNLNHDQLLNYTSNLLKNSRNRKNDDAIAKAESLVAGGFIREDAIINALVSGFSDWHKTEHVISTCRTFKNVLDSYKFDYTLALERRNFAAKCFDFFIWLLDGIRYSLTKLEPVLRDVQKSVQFLLETLFEFCDKQIYCLMIYAYINHLNQLIDQEIILRQVNIVVDKVDELKKIDFESNVIALIEKLPTLVSAVLEGPKARALKPCSNVIPDSRPGILTLGSIYACFKTHNTDFDVGEAILIFSHTVGVPRAEMICDLLRVGLLIQLKEADAGRLALADIFVFLRIPNILKILVNYLNVTKEQIVEGLVLFLQFKSLLNEADLNNQCNFFDHLCTCLVETEVMTDEQATDLIIRRRTIIETNDELGQMLESTDASNSSALRRVRIADQIASALYSCLKNDNKLLTLVDKVLLKTDGTVERVFAVMSANGDLDEFVDRMVQINKRSEAACHDAPILRNSRMNAFDVSFMILVKLKYMFNDLRLHDYSEGSRFQTWWTSYEACLLKRSPMSVPAFDLEGSKTHYGLLKSEGAFWTETSDLSIAIDSIPGIGENMLDECRRAFLKTPEDVKKVILPLKELPCLLVCLVQWLETKQPTMDLVYELAKFFESILLEFQNDPNCSEQLAFAIYLVDYGLKHLIKKKLKEPCYTWLVTSARRELPSLRHFEVPDEQIMKEAYIFATQQAWANPGVIQLITNSNFKIWVRCWLKQILKIKTEDEVFAAVKLFLATGFVRGISTLSEMSQQLVDLLMLPESPIINLNCARPLTWLLVRLLILQIYSDQVRRRQESQRKGKTLKRKRSQIEAEETFWTPPKKLQKVDDMIMALNLKFDKEVDDSLKEQIVKQYDYIYEMQKDLEKMISIHIFDEDKNGIPDLDLDDEPLPSGEFWPLPKTIHRLNHDLFRNFEGITTTQVAISSTTISMTLRRIEKQVKVPVLRAPVTFAVYLLNELAVVPRSRYYYKLLLTYLWPDFFVHVTRVEPFGLSLNEMLKMYDFRDKRQLEHLIYFACLKRRYVQKQKRPGEEVLKVKNGKHGQFLFQIDKKRGTRWASEKITGQKFTW